MLRILRDKDPLSEETINRLVDRAVIEKRVEPLVREIIEAVRERGDAGVVEFIRRYDGVALTAEGLRVTQEEIRAAADLVCSDVQRAIKEAKARIEAFHAHEMRESWETELQDGVRFGQLVRPLSRVGIYVPGGEAGYPSTVLMNAVPALIAGVERILLATPPTGDGRVPACVLFAAACCGISEIYRVGGAQAIAAMAYGTETIPQVDKIVGPGNVYVNVAKRLVFGVVDIDGLAGPSELVVLAEDGADPVLIAADLLSQAEHDPLATAVLVTPSLSLAQAVGREIERQIACLSRADVIAQALANRGATVIVDDLEDGIEMVNRLAPEHLEVMIEGTQEVLSRLRHVGMVLLGEHSAVSFSDYGAGPTHVLPTGGAARFASPLSVAEYMKHTNYLAVPRCAGAALAECLEPLARIEGFSAHVAAMRERRETADA